MINEVLMRSQIHKACVTLLGSFLLLTFIGCGSSTNIDRTWTAPRAEVKPLQKVVTVFISNDTTLRHSGEDQLVRDLRARGVDATPAYAVLGDEKISDVKSVKSKLRERGFDGVVTMRVIDRDTGFETAPATFEGYWGYWGGIGYSNYSDVYVTTVYRLETAMYSLDSGRLIWSALTRTVDPDSANQLLRETTKVIASEVTQRGLAG
jgi:hypothetical protein